MIHDIGDAIGVQANAKELNAKIRGRLDAMRAEAKTESRAAVLIVVGHTPGLLSNLVVASPSTYLGELLEIAGGRNAMPASAIAYPRISLETVVRANPDVILDLSTMGESDNIEARAARLREPWLSHRELNAVRSNRIFGLPSEPLTTPGPRVVESAEMLREKIRQTAGAR
jgi:iron complex transport system substrate-binding protein